MERRLARWSSLRPPRCEGRQVSWDAGGVEIYNACKNRTWLCGLGCGSASRGHDGVATRLQWKASSCGCAIPDFAAVRRMVDPKSTQAAPPSTALATAAASGSVPPIFVVGCGHSGTTLLRAMLDAHPRLCCGPEHGLFSSRPPALWNASLPRPPAWAGKPAESAALRREYCCQREALCGALEAEGASLLRYANGVLGAYCAAQGKARWVHKHPSDVHSVGALLGAFPGASVLYVVRDGRDVACSLAERLGSFKSGVERWARDNAAMRPWWAHPAVLTVRYESLVTEPRATLERVLDHVGEAWDGAVLRHTERPQKYGGHCAKAELTAAQAHAERPPPRTAHDKRREWEMNQPVSAAYVGLWKACFAKRSGAARTFDQFGGAAMLRELGYADAEGQPSARRLAEPSAAPVAAPFPTEAPSSSCVFMTGGPLRYLPGIRCVASRLHALKSSYPLVVAAEAGDEDALRAALAPYPNARVARWEAFPHHFGGRWGATRVLDKLNVLGAPFGRVVWLDADVLVRRSVDELCALPPNVSFAAAPNAGFRARTCFDPNGGRGAAFKCQTCAADDDGGGGAGAKPRCRYELNSAVMAVRPLGAAEFASRVVRPVQAGAVGSRDGGDQGAYNTLLYTHALFGAVGAGARVLPSTYNALARVQKLRPKEWAAMAAGGPSLVHFSRETKPWGLYANASAGRARYAASATAKASPLQREWLDACAAS